MQESISLIGVLIAALSSFVVGGFWYSPSLFLKQWQSLTDTTEEQMKKRMVPSMATIGVMSLITAYVLAHMMSYASNATGITGIAGGIQTAFWLWLGMGLTTIFTVGIMEQRSYKLHVITAGNRLVTLLLMGIILGFFM